MSSSEPAVSRAGPTDEDDGDNWRSTRDEITSRIDHVLEMHGITDIDRTRTRVTGGDRNMSLDGDVEPDALMSGEGAGLVTRGKSSAVDTVRMSGRNDRLTSSHSSPSAAVNTQVKVCFHEQ